VPVSGSKSRSLAREEIMDFAPVETGLREASYAFWFMFMNQGYPAKSSSPPVPLMATVRLRRAA
jgi:hypothetical protein